MWYYWFHKEDPRRSTIPFTSIRGADWFLEEDRSYEIVSQKCVPGTQIICIRTLSKPKDWIGPFYLESTAGTQQILKKDKKGVWFWRQGWMGIHWNGEGDWPAVEQWMRAPNGGT